MAHFAKVTSGKVIEVIVAEPDFFDNFIDNSPGEWIQCSYNTRGGVHYSDLSTLTPSEDQSKAMRYNYPGVGFTYDREIDAFIPPKQFDSWILNEDTCCWEAPVPMPESDSDERYEWNEDTISWQPIGI